jgi:GNAT superfamily N-acetyltransferase
VNAVIRPATPDDVPALVAIGRAFAAESGFPGTFSESAARRMLAGAIADPDWIVLVLEQEAEVRGGTILALHAGYAEEPQAYVQMFYVLPAWRGTETGRRLVAAICEAAEARGCVAVYASANAAIGGANERLFTNLFAKFGFRPLAPVMVRTSAPKHTLSVAGA